MFDLITVLGCLASVVEPTTLRQWSRIVAALLVMTGRVTMRGMARWTEEGGSYRTIQRFFNTVLPWGKLGWLFFRQHLFRRDEVYLMVGDESVVTKAGRHTSGLDRFFSSIYNCLVRGLSFFTLSLVGVQEGVSHPLLVEQVVPTPEAPSPATATDGKARKTRKARKTSKEPDAALPPRQRGWPKGSQNKDKTKIEPTPEWSPERMGLQWLGSINGLFPVTYLVLDGHFGNNNVLQVVQQRLGLHLICKRRYDSALYFPYDGPQKKSGRRRYGTKLDYRAIPLVYKVLIEVKSIRNKSIQEGISAVSIEIF